jgi:hypothetical protein
VQVAVIGDREGGHPEGNGPADQVIDPIGSVEERVLTVAMKVNERHQVVRRFLPGFRFNSFSGRS